MVLVFPEEALFSGLSQSLQQNLIRIKNWLGDSLGQLIIVVSKATDCCECREYLQDITKKDDGLNAQENREYLVATLRKATV